MKPEVRDPYIMSAAADVGKKQTRRDVGVPYLPVEGDGVCEMTEPLSGNGKLRKIFKIAIVVAVVILFVGLGVVCLIDSPSDLFKIQPPAGAW